MIEMVDWKQAVLYVVLGREPRPVRREGERGEGEGRTRSGRALERRLPPGANVHKVALSAPDLTLDDCTRRVSGATLRFPHQRMIRASNSSTSSITTHMLVHSVSHLS